MKQNAEEGSIMVTKTPEEEGSLRGHIKQQNRKAGVRTTVSAIGLLQV